MNLVSLLAAPITVGVTFVFSILVNMYLRRNIQYAISRLFLKKDETIKALKSIAVGTFVFAAGRIIALCYSFNFVPQSILFASSIVTTVSYSSMVNAANMFVREKQQHSCEISETPETPFQMWVKFNYGLTEFNWNTREDLMRQLIHNGILVPKYKLSLGLRSLEHNTSKTRSS